MDKALQRIIYRWDDWIEIYQNEQPIVELLLYAIDKVQNHIDTHPNNTKVPNERTHVYTMYSNGIFADTIETMELKTDKPGEKVVVKAMTNTEFVRINGKYYYSDKKKNLHNVHRTDIATMIKMDYLQKAIRNTIAGYGPMREYDMFNLTFSLEEELSFICKLYTNKIIKKGYIRKAQSTKCIKC